MTDNGCCPACGSRDSRVFLDVPQVPVQSCRLVDSRADALDFPRGDLRLAFCNACGFIWNQAFDPALVDYAESYEETQGFSPRFRMFARELARRWVERYSLQDRRVLEIGCGKGEFLEEMLRAGAGRGTGIDPSLVPERLSAEARERATWIRDFFSESHLHVAADAVVCRHTLEHIAPVAEFLRLIRRSIGERPEVPVLFELPDVVRVLDEVAFWDIYYEHCSYFSAGSLARLFRRGGFDVLSVALEYDGQYLVLEARPDGEPSRSGPVPLEESVDELRAKVDRFVAAYRSTVERWSCELQQIGRRNERVVLWGGGSKAVAFLTALPRNSPVEYVVDINPHKHGKFIAGSGQEVVAPEFLSKYQPELVVAMNPIYLEEIQASLDHLDVPARLVAV